jgi:hypothetical protein
MISILHVIIITLCVVSMLVSSNPSIFAIELNSTDSITNDFTYKLKSKIHNLISDALNDTSNIINSSSLSNGSNLTSSQFIISKNKVMSSSISNGSADGDSIMKDKITTLNGVCNSVKVGSNGNDSLLSSGNCNDELTGGKGADKFNCGEGNDTIRDYNSKEGDVILDPQNCEKVT